jgi:hypothetical protein
MATVKILLHSDGTYSVKEREPINVPFNGKLKIVVPKGPPQGCLICFDKEFELKKEWLLTEDVTLHLTCEAKDTTWYYDIFAPSGRCPTERKRMGAHSIQIGS